MSEDNMGASLSATGLVGAKAPEPPSRLGPTGDIPCAELEAAIRLALICHAGQVDKGGQPYILHPLRVMLACKTPQERVVAVLHDVVEDSDVDAGDIEMMFGPAVADAVATLTRKPNENYAAFIKRCGRHPIARRVKLADLADNMDIARLNREPTTKDFQRQLRYADARNELMAAELGAATK